MLQSSERGFEMRNRLLLILVALVLLLSFDRYRFEVSLDGQNWSITSKAFSVPVNATDQPPPADIDPTFPSRPIEKLK